MCGGGGVDEGRVRHQYSPEDSSIGGLNGVRAGVSSRPGSAYE